MHVHDTIRGAKVPFEPRDPGRITIYACGPTVYDVPHMGHARSALTYDVIRRYLAWRGFDVTYVSNITDVDDNIIERAAREGRTEPEVAADYEAVYVDAMERIGVLPPDVRPHATEYVSEMVAIIEQLLTNDFAYVVEGAGVYFPVARLDDYGALPHRTRADLEESAGARVEVDERKRSPLDFVLWKAAKPGEPSWPSPWGEGRPGWHIECVAMALDLLGDGFDIHGGGDDLVFPHHENERAEAVGAGREFARYWVHHGMVVVEGTKMSKSLGNFRTVADALEEIDPRALRVATLQTHYRKPMEMGRDSLAAAEAALRRFDALVRRASAAGLEVTPADGPGSAALDADAVTAFTDAMDDDFATPSALATVFDCVHRANTAIDDGDRSTAERLARTAVTLAGALGVRAATGDRAGDTDIDRLVGARTAARSARDWAEADRIRDELAERGVVLEDTPTGTVWHRT